MFDSNKVKARIADVHTCDQLVELLASSVGYSYGDKFFVGNAKLGSSTTVADEAHPGWTWQPLTGLLYSVVHCLAATPLIVLTTGTRNLDRDKTVLTVWTSSNAARAPFVDALKRQDGDATIGAKLAAKLGYSDWAVVSAADSSADKVATWSRAAVEGVTTVVQPWAAPCSLNFPDDGAHEYVTQYDPYSDKMLLDKDAGVPTMLLTGYNPGKQAIEMLMSKSSYDADYQNTCDIVHAALDAKLRDAAEHIDGLVNANGAIYSAITMLSVFGNKFSDVVGIQSRIEQAGSYIPRP